MTTAQSEEETRKNSKEQAKRSERGVSGDGDGSVREAKLAKREALTAAFYKPR